MPTPYSNSELLERVRWYIKIRWSILFMVAIPTITPQFIQQGPNQQVRSNLMIFGGALLINAVFFGLSRLHFKQHLVYIALASAQVTLDMTIAATAVFTNGGIESRSSLLFVLPILMCGAFLGRVGIYVTGVVAASLYGLILTLDYYNILIPRNIAAPALHRDNVYFFRSVFFSVTVLLAITVVTDFVARLIRHRTQLAEELKGVQTEQAKTMAILRGVGSALVSVDRHGRIEMVNEMFEHLMKTSRQQVIGQPISDALQLLDSHGQPVPFATSAIAQLLNQTATDAAPDFLSDYYLRLPDGGQLPIMAHLSPVVIDQNVIGLVMVFDDASNPKAVQQLKTNFVAMVAHQLKTPISEIKGFVDNMLSGITGQLNAKQQDYLERIQEVANRCNKLAAYLLDLAILEHGKLAVGLKPTSLNNVLANVAHIFGERITQRGLKLEIKQTEPVMVVADSDMLVEIVSNLVGNSIAYSQKGTITLAAHTEGGYGTIEVSDEGKGMSEEQLSALFHKETILTGIPGSESGTGLGLYLASELIRLQHGKITAKSTPGTGTTITIKLPLHKEKGSNNDNFSQ